MVRINYAGKPDVLRQLCPSIYSFPVYLFFFGGELVSDAFLVYGFEDCAYELGV